MSPRAPSPTATRRADVLHERPRCWGCQEVIEYDPIFVAPCDHEACPSVCMHGICLMEWREYRRKRVEQIAKWVEEHQTDD